MESNASYEGASIFPELHYDDARAGITFLERAFGFETHEFVAGAADAVAHAELRVGSGFVMLSTREDDGFAYRTPRGIGGVNTGGVYTAVPDVDALHARALHAGARIARALGDTEYGSREFSAIDPEGFLWHFGTYHPTVRDGDAGTDAEVYAGMRYRDVRRAIAWLIRAFGFEENFVVAGNGAEIAHAQLRFGNSLLMLGSARDDDFGYKTPLELGGAYTQTLNAYVADPDAHYAHAISAAAEIVVRPSDTAYGSRGYVVRDPEGYVWNFGTYHPAPVSSAANVP